MPLVGFRSKTSPYAAYYWVYLCSVYEEHVSKNVKYGYKHVFCAIHRMKYASFASKLNMIRYDARTRKSDYEAQKEVALLYSNNEITAEEACSRLACTDCTFRVMMMHFNFLHQASLATDEEKKHIHLKVHNRMQEADTQAFETMPHPEPIEDEPVSGDSGMSFVLVPRPPIEPEPTAPSADPEPIPEVTPIEPIPCAIEKKKADIEIQASNGIKIIITNAADNNHILNIIDFIRGL